MDIHQSTACLGATLFGSLHLKYRGIVFLDVLLTSWNSRLPAELMGGTAPKPLSPDIGTSIDSSSLASLSTGQRSAKVKFQSGPLGHGSLRTYHWTSF